MQIKIFSCLCVTCKNVQIKSCELKLSCVTWYAAMTFVSLTSLKMLFIAALPTLETLETGASISHHKHQAGQSDCQTVPHSQTATAPL